MNTKPQRFKKIAASVGLIIGSAMATFNCQAASQTWTNAPVDNTWTNIGNWVNRAVPGVYENAGNAVQNADVATFNTAIPVSGIGNAANPIWIDVNTNTFPLVTLVTNRQIGGMFFDTANCGAYVVGSTTGNILYMTAAYNNTTIGSN